MAKIYATGSARTTGAVTLKQEVLIRSGLQINDEIIIYVNSRKEVIIKKVTKWEKLLK